MTKRHPEGLWFEEEERRGRTPHRPRRADQYPFLVVLVRAGSDHAGRRRGAGDQMSFRDPFVLEAFPPLQYEPEESYDVSETEAEQIGSRIRHLINAPKVYNKGMNHWSWAALDADDEGWFYTRTKRPDGEELFA